MEAFITMVNQNNFYVGDVEEVASGPYDGMTFVRVNYDETGRKKLNNILNSHLSMTEWVTLIVDTNYKVIKIVVFSEEDNKEYDVTDLFSTKLLNKLLKDIKKP